MYNDSMSKQQHILIGILMKSALDGAGAIMTKILRYKVYSGAKANAAPVAGILTGGRECDGSLVL